MMRVESAKDTALGRTFVQYMSAGKLVPDDLVLDVIRVRLQAPDARNGAIFDGYPRTLDQASGLDKILSDRGQHIHCLIAIQVPMDELIERVSNRRVCRSCGHIYHLRYSPPPATGICTNCSKGPIEQRDDDRVELVKHRYQEYLEKSKPVLNHYRSVVHQVNGVGAVDEVFQRIVTALETSDATVKRGEISPA